MGGLRHLLFIPGGLPGDRRVPCVQRGPAAYHGGVHHGQPQPAYHPHHAVPAGLPPVRHHDPGLHGRDVHQGIPGLADGQHLHSVGRAHLRETRGALALPHGTDQRLRGEK